jgi:hypothetical protein
VADAREPMVCGEPAADRLMRSLDYRLHPDARRLTRDEVAVVLHALADHTAIKAALSWRHAPHATSVGRWCHDVADHLTERWTPWNLPASEHVGHPTRDCPHPDRHLCKAFLLCSDCCHVHAEQRQTEAARRAFTAGHFAATDDLNLHDPETCPATKQIPDSPVRPT